MFSTRLILGLLLFGTLSGLSAEEWWAWATADVWQSGPFTGSMFLGSRFDLDDGAIAQTLAPRLKYELVSWLDAGVNFSLLNIDSAAPNDQHLQGRPELELNPKFNLTKHLRLDWRNRIEWRWNEGNGLTSHRSRHRLQLAYTLPHPLGPLRRVFANNEWLLDLHGHGWNENRLVPAGLTFRLSPQADLDVFYLLQSTRPRDNWRMESVIGTHLRCRF